MNGPETPRHSAERLLAWCAAALWFASWFLPVVEDFAGWAAFRAALTGPFRDTLPAAAEESIPQILSAFTNVVFVAIFLTWWRGRISLPAILLKIAIACLLINCYWLVQAWRTGQVGALLIGYYAWLASFALLVAVTTFSVVSNRRTSKTPTAGTPA
jgi:hypothetical protein